MTPRISIVMTPYQREKQLNVTLPTIIGADEIVIEPDDRDHSQQAWMNPAPILNRAIAKASGDIIIQQNAECLHFNNVVSVMRNLPRGQVWFASCLALKENGDPDRWYCHPEYRPRPDFFCGAIWKDDMLRYNETFTEYGWENIELTDRLEDNGITFHWLYPDEALVYHQWHAPFSGNSQSRTLYEAMNK